MRRNPMHRTWQQYAALHKSRSVLVRMLNHEAVVGATRIAARVVGVFLGQLHADDR